MTVGDADDLRHLDQLDFLAEQAARTPLSRGRVTLPVADFDFLLALIGANAGWHLDRLDAIAKQTVTCQDHVNLTLMDFKALLHIAHVVVQSVSVDEAIQRG